MTTRLRVFVAALLLIGALAGCTRHPGEPAVDTDSEPIRFTAVALNACWLFDGVGEEAFSTAPQCPEDAQAHLSAVAAYLVSLDPDYISLAEVEDAAILDRLNRALGGTYEPVFVQGKDDYTGQDVAALSRVPVLASGRSDASVRYPIAESQFRVPMGREEVYKHYWATTELSGRTITFIGVHFLAYPDEQERIVRREAQASIIRDLAKGFLDEGHDLVILGDVNDFDAEACDAAGNRPASCVSRLLKDIDPELEGDELANISDRIPQEERYTFWYDRDGDEIDDGAEEHSQIDHIYVSQNLLSYLVDVRIDHSYESRTVSDHWPVIATFEFP
jgi:endonuclease/exonuclease/phosphatase family metal-dependent hydrolase